MTRLNQYSGKILMQERKDAGLTQEELAELIGLSRETISAIENGQNIGSIKIEILRAWDATCEKHKKQRGKQEGQSRIKLAILSLFNFY